MKIISKIHDGMLLLDQTITICNGSSNTRFRNRNKFENDYEFGDVIRCFSRCFDDFEAYLYHIVFLSANILQIS